MGNTVWQEFRKYYDANEAYELSKKNNEEIVTKELNDLFITIDPYVKIGKTECYTCNISDIQKDWLLSHGYKVYTSKKKDYTKGMICIDWNIENK